MPRISVFITSYNQRDYLIEAIETVLGQTLTPTQIIIVDDCSSDDSSDVISDYASRYPELITPIYHKENMGVTRTRIDALNAVNGDYVTYVDGDDRYLPQKLEKEFEALKRNHNAQIAFSNNYYMSADGMHTGIWIDEDDHCPPEGNVFWQTFGRSYPKNSLFRMELVEYEAWKRVGFHDTSLKIYEDFDMRIRLTKPLQTVYVDEPLTEIRYHGKGLSSLNARNHVEALKYIYRNNV